MVTKRKPASKITGYTYTGGAYIHGVPARDLSPAEYKQHAAAIESQQRLINRVLYAPVMVAPANEEVKP